MNELTFTGELGADRVEHVRNEIARHLDGDRPMLRITLTNVDRFHLGIANVLVAARAQARSRCGDIDVIVERESEPQRLLRLIGIVGTITP